ncbi:MAG: prepilin-type N-terminal cleavage/methylation domain-containing protein [Verrucomicrobiota bacterium]
MKAHHKKTSHGFTLIELLVSMVITTIIITVLVTVTVTSLDIWNRNRAEVRASSQGKAMVDSMAADFESMAVRRGNDFQWLFAEFMPPTQGPNGNLSPTSLDLIFFSAATDRYEGKVGDVDDDKGGDISTIGYKLIYKDPIGDDSNDKFKTFVLYRKIVNPDETFTNLLGKADLKTAFLPYAPGGSASIDEKKNFICENVYQFTVKFHVDVQVTSAGGVTTTQQTAVTLNDAQQFLVTGNGLTTTGVSAPTVDAANLASGRLTAVEVSLTVLTDSAVKQLRGRSFDADQLSDFIAENSYQYSKLIQVPSY